MRIDMSGQTFNKLTVISKAGVYKNHDTIWNCICKCGKETVVRGSFLRNGHTKTCGNCNVYKNAGSYMMCYVDGERFFIFDHENLELISKYRWSLDENGYVLGFSNGTKVKLHRLLMNPEKNKVVDHINGNPSDCRKFNLRIATQKQNCFNQRLSKASTTGFKGVCFDKRHGKYMAHIHPNGRFKFLGYFSNPENAAIAYNNAALHYFGEYAKTNNIKNRGEEKNA